MLVIPQSEDLRIDRRPLQSTTKRTDARDLELELMKLGRRYEGFQVRVGGQHVLKGIRGTVIGDYDSPERAARLRKARESGKKIEWWDQDGILLTIEQLENRYRVQNVPIAYVYHELYVSVYLLATIY